MSLYTPFQNPKIEEKFLAYPKAVQTQMFKLREMIFAQAQKNDIHKLEECLKWGEPSFLNKHGSTFRMDWKAKNPKQIALYFKCTSKLVPTFKTVFGDFFQYEKNRAILLRLDERLPRKELTKCIEATLLYHKKKTIPQLGIVI